MKTTVVRICWILGLALMILLPLAMLLTFGPFAPASAQEAAKATAKYVGAEACAKMCHKTVKQGEQLRIWQESKHAKAFEVLGTPEAKAIGKKMGIENPQESEKCLKCHITAPGAAADKVEATFANTEGVGCERCHGAGSLYKKMTIMKDKAQAAANGLLIPDEKVCTGCHNQESPVYKPFNFKEAVKKIAHAKPKEG